MGRKKSMKYWLLVFGSLFANLALAQSSESNIVNLPNTITVGHQDADFTAISAALSSIRNASESNPYLILVAPGTYKVRSRILMKSHVHLRGSGKKLTRLIGRVRDEARSLVETANNSTIESLSIEIPRNFNFPARSIISTDSGRATLKNVILEYEAHPSLPEPIGIEAGTWGIDLDNVDISVFQAGRGRESIGILGFEGGLIRNSTVSGYIALRVLASGAYTVENSQLSGVKAIENFDSIIFGTTVRLRNSVVSGQPPITNVGTDADFNPLSIHVSRSTLISRDGVYTTGPNIFCVASDNNKGQALNNSCTEL